MSPRTRTCQDVGKFKYGLTQTLPYPAERARGACPVLVVAGPRAVPGWAQAQTGRAGPPGSCRSWASRS